MNQSTQAQSDRNALLQSIETISELNPTQKTQMEKLKWRIESGQTQGEQLVAEIRNLSRHLIQEKDENVLSFRQAMKTVKQSFAQIKKSEHLSARQHNNIDSAVLSEGESPAEAILSLSQICSAFAEDAIYLRSQSRVVVGEEHQNLKASQANIIAGDVAWSSRQVIKSISPLLHRVSQDFPNNTEISTLYKVVKDMNSKPKIDFFEAISLMEESIREVSRLQGRKDDDVVEHMKIFHGHLKSMHTSLNKTIIDNANFGQESTKDRNLLNNIMSGFKEASCDEFDPVKLKEIIAENVKHMTNGFEKVMARQDIHIKQQQSSMEALRAKVKQQECVNSKLLCEKTSLAEALQDMSSLSTIDELTQVSNRRAYEQRLTQLDKAMSDNHQINQHGVIVMDIDHFKKINDTYGHRVGDKILRTFGTLINAIVRCSGLSDNVELFRYGGEEFAMVYEGIGTLDAIKLAERCRATLASKNYTKSGEKITVTMSIGVANYTSERMLGKLVFDMADKALYKAKSGGRNITAVANEQNKITRIREKQKTLNSEKLRQ
jgi:diguanylate cyclase (GGDEF)-like protein